MGSQNSTNFINLDEIPIEKSLYSYKVILSNIYKDNKKDNNLDILNFFKKDNKYKLKLYPSCLSIKNDVKKFNFDYYNILSWYTSENCFSFKTNKKINYVFICENPVQISNNLKEICLNIKNNAQKFNKSII